MDKRTDIINEIEETPNYGPSATLDKTLLRFKNKHAVETFYAVTLLTNWTQADWLYDNRAPLNHVVKRFLTHNLGLGWIVPTDKWNQIRPAVKALLEENQP